MLASNVTGVTDVTRQGSSRATVRSGDHIKIHDERPNLIYLGCGALILLWPGVVQTIFRDAAFVGNEAALIRVIGMAVMIIGWLYLFGGLSCGRRIVAAGVLDRLVLVPLVLVPLAIAEVFPHFLIAFAVLDPTLGVGAWLLLSFLDFTRPPARHRCSSRNCRRCLTLARAASGFGE